MSIGKSGPSLLFVTVADVGVLNGPAIHILNLVKYLGRWGIEIDLLCPRPSGPLRIDHGQNVRRHSPAFGRLRGMPSAVSIPGLAYRMVRLRNVEAVYLRAGVGTWALAVLCKKALRSRLIVEYNGWLPADLEAAGYARLFSRLAEWMQLSEAKLADRIRVVTPGLGKLLVDRGIHPDRIEVIGNGTDIDTFRPLDMQECRAAHGLSGAGRILAVVGNLWSALDLPTVFEALRELREAGMEIELLVIGDGVSRQSFQERAHDCLGPGARVRWLGSQPPEKVNELLNAADAVLAPFMMHNEVTGLAPLKIRDYAAAGRPCVATAISGISSMSSEPWMFLTPPGNPKIFARNIEAALAADPVQVCIAARTYAEQNFDWTVIARQVAALLYPEDGVRGSRLLPRRSVAGLEHPQ